MKPGILIVGPDGSGKTKTAREIALRHCLENQIAFINGRGIDINNKFLFQSFTPGTKVLIIDNIIKTHLIDRLIAWYHSCFLVCKYGEKSFELQIDTLIITCAEEIKSYHLSRYREVNKKFEIVELTHKN